MTALWISVPLGLIIVLIAVGAPYWLTHRHMRPHYDISEAREYLDATGKTPEEAATGQPGELQRRRVDSRPERSTGPAGAACTSTRPSAAGSCR